MRSKDRFEPDETSTEVNAARRCGLHNGIGMADGDDKARRADHGERVRRGMVDARMQRANRIEQGGN
jgi:hypothetical protein